MKHGIILFLSLMFPALLLAEVPVVPKFPDFTLKNLDGESVSLSEVTDNGPAIISFWATWCKPCIKELRKLNGMSDFLEKHNVTLLAINEDGVRTRPRIKPFVRKEKWEFSVLMDPGNKVKVAANVAELPEFFIVGEGNAILYHHSGYKPGDEAEYKEKIEALFPVVEQPNAAEDAGE